MHKLFSFFKNLAKNNERDYFSSEYEKYAIQFLEDYDQERIKPPSNKTELDILNQNFSEAEIRAIILSLPNGKSPGLDGIPAEFFKAGVNEITPLYTLVINYILEMRQFPSDWCEGIRSAIFKAGDILDPACYRGVNILICAEKIFEIGANRRLEFANQAFEKVDASNGGFLKGVRTTDNIFILQGLITRQLTLGKKLFLCFVDFSVAFNNVNRHLKFFKLVKSGWHGRLIDTLRSLYRQTRFRTKHFNMASESVDENLVYRGKSRW